MMQQLTLARISRARLSGRQKPNVTMETGVSDQSKLGDLAGPRAVSLRGPPTTSPRQFVCLGDCCVDSSALRRRCYMS